MTDPKSPCDSSLFSSNNDLADLLRSLKFPPNFDLPDASRKNINDFFIWMMIPASSFSLHSLQFLAAQGRLLTEQCERLIARKEKENGDQNV